MKYYVADWIIDSDKIMDGSYDNVLNKSVELEYDLKLEDFITDDAFYGFRFLLAVKTDEFIEHFFATASDQLDLVSWEETTLETYKKALSLSVREQRNDPDYRVNLRILDSIVKAGLMNKNRRKQ